MTQTEIFFNNLGTDILSLERMKKNLLNSELGFEEDDFEDEEFEDIDEEEEIVEEENKRGSLYK